METRGENPRRSSRWGFLEDMESVGRLDMVVGDEEGAVSEPVEEAAPESDSRQEEQSEQ